MSLAFDDSTESWEDWEFQIGTIPAPRDPRKSNHWYINDAIRLFNEFVELTASSSHHYNFHLASEYELDNGRVKKFFSRKRKENYIDWFLEEYGEPDSLTGIEVLYTEVFNWTVEILALLQEMDDLVEITHSNNVLDVDRYGDRDGGIRKLYEMWEDVRTIVDTYKTRKWHSAFQSTII